MSKADNVKAMIRRDNVYRIGATERFPSTTEICGAVNKPYLIRWAARVAAQAVLDDPEQYNTADKAADAVNSTKSDAAERGRAVHDLITNWAQGGGVLAPGPLVVETLAGYERSFRAFIQAWNPKPLYTEVVVFNRTHKYAGRLDLICQISNKTWLLDFKTSKSVYWEHGLQLAAYRNAEFMWIDDQEMLMPGVDMMGVVLLGKEGMFDFKTVDEPFEVFLALKTVWSRMKAQGG